MQRFSIRAGAVVLAAFAMQSTSLAAAAPHNIRGTIATVAPNALTVTTNAGSTVVKLGAKTGIVGVVPARMSDITPGTFIGTANVVGSGSARALEVVVFPKAMAGAGEGDYPWDLPASGGNGHSMMTNGTVAAGHSMMTNATVSSVTGAGAKTVKLTYKGGTKLVTIPTGVPIVRLVPGSKALLVAGAHVVAFPGRDGTAGAIAVGENGVVPPM